MDSAIKLLVVEDDKDILTLVLKHLRKSGFDPTGFADPIKALDDFKADPAKYALVLTDIRMPGMNGVDLAREILATNPQMKVLIMTAHEFLVSDLKIQLPFVTYQDVIRKPFRLTEICSRVKQQVNAN